MKKTGPPAEPDYRHLAEFRFQIRRFLDFSTRAARRAGIEPQQHQLLLAVKGAPRETATTVQYLAQRLLVRHNSAVELVNRSVKKGLVERHQDLSDLRRVFVKLTARGEKVLRSLSENHRAELTGAGQELLRSLKPLLREGRAAGPSAAPGSEEPGKQSARRSSLPRSAPLEASKTRQ